MLNRQGRKCLDFRGGLPVQNGLIPHTYRCRWLLINRSVRLCTLLLSTEWSALLSDWLPASETVQQKFDDCHRQSQRVYEKKYRLAKTQHEQAAGPRQSAQSLHCSQHRQLFQCQIQEARKLAERLILSLGRNASRAKFFGQSSSNCELRGSSHAVTKPSSC